CRCDNPMLLFPILSHPRSTEPRQPLRHQPRARIWPLCAALLAAMVAMPAQAQTSVRLYGTVDAAVSATRVSGAPTQKSLLSGGLSDSLWGLQGREALGGDSYAAFALEGGLDAAHGALD